MVVYVLDLEQVARPINEVGTRLLASIQPVLAPSASAPVHSQNAADSLAAGLSFMLVANVLQRGIGFVRNMSFCRFLSEDSLGLWALASSFFVLAAPLVVLGLPGTFGKLVETYRVHGQLVAFLRRTVTACLLGLFLSGACLLLGTPYFGTVIFGVPISYSTMAVVVVTLGTVVVFNTATEILNGLRRSKIVSSMHSLNSLTFTLVSLIGLSVIPDWRVIVVAFAIGSTAGLLPAWRVFRDPASVVENDRQILSHTQMWSRVFPFAASIWSMNLLMNLFDVVDRYMLLYMSTGEHTGAAIVGQFHSARILPVLLTSLTMMLSSMLLPYLAADWESGSKKKVQESLQLTFKATMIFFFAISIASLIVAPFLFETMLEGRYPGGMAIMPIALLHCCLAAVAALLQNYFWCAERGRIVGLITLVGLLANIGLNLWWVPLFGLKGAMTATAISGGLILLMTVFALRRFGITLDRSSFWIGLLPICLVCSPLAAVTAVCLALLFFFKSEWLFDTTEKKSLDESIRPILHRLGIRLNSIWYGS